MIGHLESGNKKGQDSGQAEGTNMGVSTKMNL